VYYISARQLDDPGLREADEMATMLASRQFADWRELRFKPFTSPRVRKAIAELASRMRDTFWQPPVAPVVPAGHGQVFGSAVGSAERAAAAGRATAKTEPPTHVVDAFPERGDFTTVSAAIQAAKPGDRILVRPGLYEEALVVDKPLEILGDGPVSDIEIRARGAHVLVFQASIGRVANLTLRQAGGEGTWFGVDIGQGGLALEGCDISSQSSACLEIRDGADPRLRRNQIHNGKQGGVFVYNGGLGTLEDNHITGNALAGVAIATGADPTLRRNQIHDNQNGVLIHIRGLGTLEDNDITGAVSGVQINSGSNPTLRGNQIHDNKANGVLVNDGGLGTLEDNDITGNTYSGVQITKGSSPTLRANRINRNGYQAISINGGSLAVIEDNDLTGNARGAWYIAEDCKENVTRARNKE
jgi:parallel beta-helix repeat protein